MYTGIPEHMPNWQKTDYQVFYAQCQIFCSLDLKYSG